MKYTQNTAMKELIGDHVDLDALTASSPPDFQEFIEDGFKEVDGCVVWSGYGRSHLDLSGVKRSHVEADLSKASLLDSRYFTTRTDLKIMVQSGLGYAKRLFDALAQSGLEGPFKVIVAAGSVDDVNSCSVRFHRAREGQDWLLDDLDIYQDPAAVLE